MALPQDETTTEQPSIDYEALGLEPVSDEELFGFGLQTEAPEAPKAETPEIDYEALGLEPVSDKELFGFEMPKEEPQGPSDWDTLRGAEVSLRQVPQLAYGVAGLVGATSEQITGYGEALRDWGFRGYKEWEESMEPISKETDDITVAWDRAKQGDVGALVDWAQYGVGYALGQLGETAAVAVLGGLAGGAAGASAGGVGAAPAAAGGAIVAAAGKQGFKDLAKNLVEKAIASQATKIVTRQAEKEGIELTAEQLAKRASQDAIKRQAGKEIGSDVAVFGNAIGMQLGSIYGEAESKAQSEGRDLTGYDLARVWGTGIATGGLEGVVDKLGLDLLKGKLSGVLPEGRLAGAAVAGGVGTLGEVATEGVQTVGERFGAGKDILGDEALNEYINAAALGGLGGGVIGGAGGFVSGNPKENAAAKAKVAAEASKNIAPESSKLVSDQADAVINEVAQETPDEKVARLQREAQEGVGIELEEEPPVSGLPSEPVTPTAEAPVTPTPEAAVAPVEPVVPVEGAVEPTAATAPTEPIAPTEPAVAESAPVVPTRPAVDVEALSPNAKRANRILTNTGIDPETAAFVAQQYQDEIADLGGEELRAFVLDKFEENGGVIPAQMRYSEDQEYYELAFGIGPEEAATLVENAKGQNTQMAQAELEQNKQWRRKDGQQITETQQGVAVAQPEAQAVPLTAGEVPPSPAIEGRRVPLTAPEAAVTPTPVAPTPVTPEVPAAVEPPALAPLRRVVKAEQTEEDVSGLVGQGLVELYNGQPVLTQAGLEALPETERPRLTPEARKIQIDTRTSEAAAEAISKNLRIGVDQVPADVRMPAGWTIEGDIYIPPTVEAAPEAEPEVEAAPEEPKVDPINVFKGSVRDAGFKYLTYSDLRKEGRAQDWEKEGGVTIDGSYYPTAVIGDTKVAFTTSGLYVFKNQVRELYESDVDTNGNTIFTIQRIVTPEDKRGQGSASKALSQITDAADKAGLTLQLQPAVISTLVGKGGELSAKQLVDWYKRNGFTQKFEGSDAVLIRSPKPTAPAIPEVVPPRQPDADPEAAANQEIQSIVEKYQTSEPTARMILANINFDANEAGVVPDGWTVETIDGRKTALSPVFQKTRRDIQVAIRKFTALERGALSARLFREGWINEDQSKEYLRNAIQRSSQERVTAAEAEANERFDALVERVVGENRANISSVVGEVSKPTIDLEAEEQARAEKPSVSPSEVLDPNEIEFMSARQALKKLAESNVISFADSGASGKARWRYTGKMVKPQYVRLQEAASVLAKTNLRALDAERINISGAGGRANREYAGNIFIPRTEGSDRSIAYLEPWVLLHEVGHTLTSDAFQKHVPDKGLTGADYYKQLKDTLKNKKVPRQVKRAITLYIDTIKALGFEKEYFKKGGLASNNADRGLRNAAARTANKLINPFTGNEITRDDMYALADMHEFYAQAWNSESFQDILKQIKVEPQKSAFQKFVDIIKDILGFESDTMAYAVIDTSLRLASLESPTDSGATVEDRIKTQKEFRAVKELPRTKMSWMNFGSGKYGGGRVKMSRNKFVKLGYDMAHFTITKGSKGLFGGGGNQWSVRVFIEEFYSKGKRANQLLPQAEIFVRTFDSKATAEEFAERLASDVNGMVNEKYGKLKSAAPRTKPSPVVRRGKFSPSVPASQQQVQSAIDESRARREQNVEPEDVEFEGEDKAYAIAPSETIGKSLRDVLRIVSETNLTNTDVFPPSEQTMQDVAAVLAQLDSPVLDTETVVSLESRGYGRDGNFSARRFPDGAIGVHDNEPQSVETYVHEGSHALTVDQIDKYLNWETSGSGKDYIDSINRAIASPATPEPVKRLFSLYTSTLEQLGLMDQFGGVDGVANWEADARYAKQKAQSRQRAGKIRKDLDNEQIYGLVDMREFVAQTFSSESFRDLLKTLKDPNAPQKSLWSAFVEAIQKILNLPQSSMAAAVIQVSVDISKVGGVTPKRTGAGVGTLGPEPTRFTEESPEAKTLSNLKASMDKVDAASEAKGGKPETQKVSEIAANWMEQGGDERALQDAITENTNLSPANAAKVAKVIARQYDIQQSIATAFLETQAGLSVEALPEGVTLPKEVDPDRPKPVMSRLFEVFMGVRVPPVKIQVNEKTALKQQIRLKAAANRAAKAEQKRTAEEVVEIIKAMELLGPVRPKQVQALAKRAARVIWTNEKSVEAFSEYAAKVVENANYDADLRDAKDAQKRAKQLSTQKKVAMSPQREVLEDVSKVPVNKLDDPRMFAEAVNYYLRGFKSVLSSDYVVIPDAEMESYLSGAQSETQRNQRDLDREANRRLAEKYGIDPDQVNEMMESIDIIKQIEAQENRDALENLLTEKAVETQQGLKGYDTDSLRADQRSIVSSMLKVDPKALDPEERQRFIRITNNIIYNNQTNGAEYFVAVAKGQQSAREAAQDSTMVAKNRAWINLLPRFVSERMQRGWALELQSIADTFRNAFGKGAMAKMYDAMGMLDLNLGFTKANNTIDEIQEKIAEFHRNLEKKYKSAARNQDGLLAEGVVGFLIQSVPKKDEVASINQRRDLIRQDIANRKGATGEPDRVAMAGRIEAILNQIDGDSVEAILNNMKREFPANHESLVWYKDTLLPQYKDFLKGFDENFNDQANNYENPNYLTIGFTSAGPSLAITPEEQGMFYDQVSLRPKQSAYTIKRVDYSEIPKDRTTGKPKEIEFNLRRNVFNGLSDQINKAYTSSGWQRIASFMKTPEAEEVFGGAANKDFFIERLNRLRLSRMRRGSMGSGGAIEKAVDSLSVISRKLGTGIALGGIYQWIKQPPDQLITAWGSGGRGDLLAKNIAPSTQKAARELLNKFSIGRRGDASSGYKYINQMEGHQNRLERYFSESKWDQAKEQAGKIADVWMIALKSSDFLAASAAWMTYYEGELNKQDIKIDDWSKEADLIESDPSRRQAAAFAEQMTDIYQGSSDPTSMATFAQSGKTGWENLVKAIFVPFNSFAIQQRMRLYSDARDAINGSKGGAGGLAGTIGGLILFHTTKRYVIPAISGAGIGVLYGLMGVDMEEPDEEKQKEEANKNWRQFLADITGNMLVGGTPQIVESQFIDAMNRASYLVSLQLENDSILNEDGEIMSYDQYSKERSPFYRYKSFDNAMSLGMLEIGLGQAEQVALQTKMLATPEEMEMYTPEEQRLLYFSALSEWLYMMRLNDADFARLVGKARRDMMSAAKDREKELQRIRSGR